MAANVLVLMTSTNGTSATAALKREGNIFTQAPISNPCEENNNEVNKRDSWGKKEKERDEKWE